MIRKPRRGAEEKADKGRFGRRKPREPLDVQLTVRFNFGDEASDAITVMNQRRVPMVDSVFRNRDRIIRSFVSLLIKSGLKSPKVTQEIFPVLRALGRKNAPRR